MQRGFSLIELSIVLVILGLLTGGILAGQSLIRAAEIRSISVDFSRHRTAVYHFRDKYFALPGDMTNATSFWTSAGGTGANTACFEAQTSASPATCNGNGDGAINNAGIVSFIERFSAWKHLANAGLIEGNYTGKTDAATGTYNGVAGLNTPASKLSGAFFDINRENFLAADANNFPLGETVNVINIFAGSNGGSGNRLLLPEEAWNIDTKLDDGRPAYGAALSTKRSAPNNLNCTTSDTMDAAYDLTYTQKNCILRFRL